jgi:hypothetical protein
MPEESKATSTSPVVWVSQGIGPESDWIIGSPAGLHALRDYIDCAIRDGDCMINHPQIEFTSIRCSDQKSYSFMKRLDMIKSIVIWPLILAILALAVYGLISLSR